MMTNACRNGHERTSDSTYVYPAREGRKPRITCRTCRDGEPAERQSQAERVAKLAEREVAKVVPQKLNAYGELRFWGMCRGISAEKYPLRMAWLMAQLQPALVQDIRNAADLLERGIFVFDAHDCDIDKIRAHIDGKSAAAKEKENDDAQL
jgi:hypothetical protein